MVKGEEILISKVKVIDIEEDFMGRDVVAFEYNGEVRQSYVVLRN